MNIRFKVYYCAKEEEGKPISSWSYEHPSKLVRAKSADKAIEIFKHKHPDLIPLHASKY